jgi:sulfur relay (sulfurtransferase) complex TusBCD TusD component (DsrE family)
VKILLIVNESPWGGTLGLTALRMALALEAEGQEIAGIFFREDGVYHAAPGRATDAGTPDLSAAWIGLSARTGARLLLCSSAAQRRLERPPVGGFRESGLADVLEIMSACDRMVTL